MTERFTFFLTLVAFGLVSCTRINSQLATNVNSGPTKTITASTNSAPSPASADELCIRLQEIRRIPYDSEEQADDPIYDGLVAAGTQAVPCLIERIVDIRVIPDPREGDPQVEGFTVGDAAVFMLLIITKQDDHPEVMLPKRYLKKWEQEGINAYFDYVDKPGSREQLRTWWKNYDRKHMEIE